MYRDYPPEMPWVIIQLRGQPFAIASLEVREMVVADNLVHVADAPPFIRGVINLRGKVIPIVDLRTRLGLPSLDAENAELCELLAARERDHQEWTSELEACVRDGRPFERTSDPRQCVFGKWYDSFTSDQRWLMTALQRFKAPHDALHQAGARVSQLLAQGHEKDAVELVERTKQGEMADLLRCFAAVRTAIRENQRETLVILAQGQRTIGVTADAALAVEKLGSIEELPAGAGLRVDGLVTRSGRRGVSPKPVLIVETERLFAATAERAPRASTPRTVTPSAPPAPGARASAPGVIGPSAPLPAAAVRASGPQAPP